MFRKMRRCLAFLLILMLFTLNLSGCGELWVGRERVAENPSATPVVTSGPEMDATGDVVEPEPTATPEEDNGPFDYMKEHDGGFETDPTSWSIDGTGILQIFEDVRENAIGGSGYIFCGGEKGVEGSLMSETVTINEPGLYDAFILYHGKRYAGLHKGEEATFLVKPGRGEARSESLKPVGPGNYMTAMIPKVVITRKMISRGKNTITILIRVKLNRRNWIVLDNVKITKRG